MESFLLDFRFALRMLKKSPGFTLTAVLALALGIGANTAIFSVINTVLLKPLGYPDPDRLVFFFVRTPTGPSYGASATKFNVWRQQTDLFQDVAAYEYNPVSLNLTGGPYPEQIRTIHVSADYFRLFGAVIARGRAFTADEDRPGGNRVVMLSYGLWRRRFGSDSDIVGKTVSLSGVTYLVVGVVDSSFDTELDSPPDAWLPFQIDPGSINQAQYFTVVGRIRSGFSLAMVNSRLQRAADEFRGAFPNVIGPEDGFAVQPLQDGIVSDVRPSLEVLAVAVALVLLIACANVANLLLVRATVRQREIAVRAAIGAGRRRIVRQLLTESIVLSLIGGALGTVIGVMGVRALLSVKPGNIPRMIGHGAAIVLDWRLFLFSVSISLIVGVAFGLVPAVAISRADLHRTLKEGGRSKTGFRENKLRAMLVISEMALALVLLIGAGLLIRSFLLLRNVNPGFDTHNVLTLRMSLAGSHFSSSSEVNQLVQHAIQGLVAVPGVEIAGATYNLPLQGAFGIPFNIVGRTPVSGQWDGRGWVGISPGYFSIFKIPVLRGRPFNDRDDLGMEPVAIVNEVMAQQFWPGGDPIGGRVILGEGYGPEFQEPARQIVGVVGDIHNGGLDRHPAPVVYVPLAQVADGVTALAGRVSSLAWIVRTGVAPQSISRDIRSKLEEATGGLPVADIRSMDEIVSQSTASADFNMSLMTIFGCLALLLAAIGIYGLMAYSVQQRTSELGIRMALGAEANQVRKMIMFYGMRLAFTGVAIGLVLAFALAHFIASFLFGVSTWDLAVFTAAPVLLSAVALLSVFLPAQRATRTDPAVALRSY